MEKEMFDVLIAEAKKALVDVRLVSLDEVLGVIENGKWSK